VGTNEEGEKRVVVVTGAASGIGASTARMLASPARHMVLVDRNPAVEELAAVLHSMGNLVEAIVADLSDVVAVQGTAAAIGDRHGRWDVLVNNAGIHPKRNGARIPVEEVDLDLWQNVLNVNLTAPFLLSQAAFRLMKQRNWGRIVNIASRAGRTYIPEGSAHYSTTKAGLIGLTRLMAGECGRYGVTVNAVAPGRVLTPLSSEGIGVELHDKAKGLLPVGRIGMVDEVAAAIRYLVSEEAGFTTGVVLDVNGGGFMG
jgi:3-oxoacyl-[acyl-carrier protein] reductase